MKKYYEFENIPCGIANIDFLKVSRRKNFKFPYSQGREKNGFIFIESGSMRYFFPATDTEDELDLTLQKGETLFIPKGTVYHATYLENPTLIMIAQFDLVYGKLPSVLNKPCTIPNYQAERQIKSLSDFVSPGMIGENRSYWYTYKMYEILWNAISCLQGMSPKFSRLLPALKDIQKNFADQPKISYYAELCNISETSFRRLFKEYTDLSPVEYRNRIRLDEARKLIETGEYLVEEAANAVGFTNISFFCRSYKKQFGHTPLGNRYEAKKA